MLNFWHRVKNNNELSLILLVILIFLALTSFSHTIYEQYTKTHQSSIAKASSLPENKQETKDTSANHESLAENSDITYYTLENLPNDLTNINKPIYDDKTISTKKESGLPLILPTPAKYYGSKTVYLTFDDGPDPINTPIVLDILKSANVKATFFVLGSLAEQRPELLATIFNNGHALGLHSYNHKYNELYRSPQDYLQQMIRTENIIYNTLGIRPVISRAPGGAGSFFTDEYRHAIKENGYLNFDWNVSSGDASKANADDIINNILSQIDNPHIQSHAIVLMHDGAGHEATVQALPTIIRMFRERGFEFRVINLTTPPEW